MFAQFVDIDLTLGRCGDRSQLRGCLPSLGGVAIRLIDDEPDLIEPALQDAHPGVFHELLAIDADGFTDFLGGYQPQVFPAELLLQRSQVRLDAPSGPIVDQREAIAIVDAAASRRAEHDSSALGIRLLLEVAGLDELAEGQAACHVSEAGEEKEEDAIEAQALDGGRRQDARVG